LYGRKRYEEFTAFLDWLILTIEKENVDALLVAGDVFDTGTPGTYAQKLYYHFLARISGSCCRHVVIIAGNHDSPSFLNAPRELLSALDVHVVGAVTESLEDEVIVLRQDERAEAIVCAVPYLRDRDIRTAEPGETIEIKNAKLLDGLKKHYAEVCALAEQKRAGSDIPVIAMGHLYTARGKTVDGDGVRVLYVGSLVHVERDAFPSLIDYCALGHLHVPQAVDGAEHIRYCGSPLPMGYGEATQEKKVVLIQFSGRNPEILEISVPCFQQLIHLEGSMKEILRRIEELKTENSQAWLEIDYTGNELIANLREMLEEASVDSAMEIRRIKNRRAVDCIINRMTENETLDDLDHEDVFKRCLDDFEIPEDQRGELLASYHKVINTLTQGEEE
jgi:exonuclease SbcD